MGNIFSNDERLRREKYLAGKDSRIVGIYEQCGYDNVRDSVQKERRYVKRRNLSFQGRNGRNYYYRSKSHSLNAILDELYSIGPEEGRRPGIPRVTLREQRKSGSKGEKNHKTLRKMSSESEIFLGDGANLHRRLTHDVNANVPQNEVILSDEAFEISKKSDDNYFAKNFDDCMKRLEVIEKEFSLIENADADDRFCELVQESNGDVVESSETEVKGYPNQSESFEESEDADAGTEGNSLTADALKSEPANADSIQANKEPISEWYSNLKQQFESKEREKQQVKAKEMSCRITGATLKTQGDNHKSEDREKDTRHYFSKLVKTNRSLIDEELPDPDKVKHIRSMFQESLDSGLKGKLGGSLQNVSSRTAEKPLMRPISTHCWGVPCQGQDYKKLIESLPREVSKPLRETMEKRLLEKNEKEYRSRRVLQPKWTDTGSVSSGVSSDLSSYDTDLESYTREGTEQDEVIISDDDLLDEVKDKHYIQNEVLEKIRSYGTSVTYYGGEMLTCSVGPLLSPTTQAIMEEIGEKYGKEKSPARAFDEFYRKYVEANERGRRIKVGRTRSFGHSDVFQKPNVLSNTEIDLYKNDLEIEIGIKKPSGNSQNSLKRKVTKSTSLENGTKIVEKSSIPPAESNVLENSAEEKPNIENESTNDNLTENIVPVSDWERKIDEEEENNKETTEENPEEKKKPVLEKEYVRSKSAPEGLVPAKAHETMSNNIESPAKEIYFSYEKSVFNGNRKSDMEFEEFEVCESPSEKLEKLEKQTSEDSEVSPDSLLEERSDEAMVATPAAAAAEEKPKTRESPLALAGSNGISVSDKKERRFNHSRWPIETTVMVDIEKEDEQTPKIITNRKTSAKAKVRLF